ncbi:MAG: phosphate acyltransferase PlsX [Armatimonadetes bacterium]|nr:phosphate acyltransferase PlsX [Armatimonadota bacterium]MDE2205083.1 phosphate acyltransferase PlsX [Armatimonadota bacterium]
MGGDLGPAEVCRGVLQAAAKSSSEFVLVGAEAALRAELARHKPALSNVRLLNAAQVIQMDEPPAQAMRSKPDASLVVAAREVKLGNADALLSIGNTGAAMAVSLLTFGRLKGIDRPAIATLLPSMRNPMVMLDAGATVDCEPKNLLQFAVMGTIFAREVLGITKPRIGLLSNGEEDAKGNYLVKGANELLRDAAKRRTELNFIGNVEGRSIFSGDWDVVVCDGFVGNVVLKTGEGVAEMVMRLVKQELERHRWMKPMLVPLLPAMRRLKGRLEYSAYGGAPLLGVNGLVFIGHGRSNAIAVANACHAVDRAVEHDMLGALRDQLCSMEMA